MLARLLFLLRSACSPPFSGLPLLLFLRFAFCLRAFAFFSAHPLPCMSLFIKQCFTFSSVLFSCALFFSGRHFSALLDSAQLSRIRRCRCHCLVRFLRCRRTHSTAPSSRVSVSAFPGRSGHPLPSARPRLCWLCLPSPLLFLRPHLGPGFLVRLRLLCLGARGCRVTTSPAIPAGGALSVSLLVVRALFSFCAVIPFSSRSVFGPVLGRCGQPAFRLC